jgi:hypothetical protein
MKKFFKNKFLKLIVKCQNQLEVLVLLAKVMTFYQNVKCLKCLKSIKSILLEHSFYILWTFYMIVKKVNKDVELIGRARVNGFGKTYFVIFGTI